MKDSIERGLRNRKLVEMGLVQVAKAIAEGKAKVTIADLDRLIRLEEFLREDLKGGQTKLIVEWVGYDSSGKRHDGSADEPESDGR
jgi:hypothetical protein